MDEPITERTPLVIAAEINKIKQETSKFMLTSAMEIGKRLKEAKDLLPHGEWGKWLVESVSYSQRTANKLMQLFKEYGDNLFAAGAEVGRSNSPVLANLTYYQALLLLGIPEDEREKFIMEHPAFTTKYEERCTACCQTIADTFQELLVALGQLARLDLAVKEKCSKDASQLAEYMVERLKEWPPVPRTNMRTVETYATHERW